MLESSIIRHVLLSKSKIWFLLRLSWWLNGWKDPFPYSYEDISKNPSCLLWSMPKVKLRFVNPSTPKQF